MSIPANEMKEIEAIMEKERTIIKSDSDDPRVVLAKEIKCEIGDNERAQALKDLLEAKEKELARRADQKKVKPTRREVLVMQGRNEKCSCGSGRKFKVCCGASKVVYCTRCEMWFDSKNGWLADRHDSGLPICPNCRAPLMELPSGLFYRANGPRMITVSTWEWPNGSFWENRKKEARESEVLEVLEIDKPSNTEITSEAIDKALNRTEPNRMAVGADMYEKLKKESEVNGQGASSACNSKEGSI